MGGGQFKAFTLIELLAIIVILAIIAVITIPIILNVIDNANKGSAIDSAYGYKDAVEKYYVQKLYEDTQFKLDGTYVVEDGMLGGIEIPISGTKSTDGTLIYKNNVLIDGCLIFDDKIVSVDESSMKESYECALIYDYVIDENKLLKRRYKTGDAIENYGGYNWHVISDDGYNVTLLMDGGEDGSYKLPNLTNGKMAHCPDGDSMYCSRNGDDYVYSWDKSAISEYLNRNDNSNDFLFDLKDKIKNKIIPVSVCNDPSRGDNGKTFGGTLANQIPSDTDASVNCSGNISDYLVRLITRPEYDLIANDATITDKTTWFHTEAWWSMRSIGYIPSSIKSCAILIVSINNWNFGGSSSELLIRPVIKVQK